MPSHLVCQTDVPAAGADKISTVLLAMSVFHFRVIGIPERKEFLRARGFAVRG